MKARLVSLMAAGLLALATAAPVGAVTIGDGFEVTTTLTVLNVPASITYEAVGGGALDPGEESAVVTISPDVSSNGDVSVTYSVPGGFTGPATLPASVRQVAMLDGANGFTRNAGLGPAFYDSDFFGGYDPLYSASQPTNATFDMELKVLVPASAAPGTYTGSMELSFTNV